MAAFALAEAPRETAELRARSRGAVSKGSTLAVAALLVLSVVAQRGGTSADSTALLRTSWRRFTSSDSVKYDALRRRAAADPGGASSSFMKTLVKKKCLGFDVCPEPEDVIPEPFYFGKEPTRYNHSGAFPDDFIWGLGTAAYQIEGGYREDGRGASIWDTFTGADTVGMPGANCSYCCQEAPCPINPAMASKGATGNVACDHYHMWQSDIALMKSMGLKHYRFSISWTRIFPTGRASDGGPNQEGLAFYNRLIDGLISAGITPYVTLYHWDLPQGLLDPPHMQGWWSRDEATGEPNGQILPEYLAYVDTCFKAFGDRVKVWVTFNEPWTFLFLGSGWGKAPNIPEFNDMTIDPYIGAHNVLNAHAAAVDLYRRKYQQAQGGVIGITNNMDWHQPKNDKLQNVAAAERLQEFGLGWFADPIFAGTGDYPEAMRKVFGERLPRFTEEQSRLLNGSSDFFGLNHYGTGWVTNYPKQPNGDVVGTFAKVSEEGLPQGASPWLFGAGWGLRELLNWIDQRYHHPAIYITEGGWSTSEHTAEEGAWDPQRTSYYANYTASLLEAIKEDGVNVRGYFAWSFIDNFEWEQGYVQRFGVSYNDFAFADGPNGAFGYRQPSEGIQMRRRKESSCWLEELWTHNALQPEGKRSKPLCVSAAVFVGTYNDPQHPGCAWNILVSGNLTTGAMSVLDMSSCTSIETASRLDDDPLRVSFSGGTIIANFSRTGGPERLLGYWNRATSSIEWGDGNTWSKTVVEAVERNDYATIVRKTQVG